MKNEKPVTIKEAIRAIENCMDYRTLCRVRRALSKQSIIARYKNKPEELAMWNKHLAELRGE